MSRRGGGHQNDLAHIGCGIKTVGEPVPGVEPVDVYEYHPPTKEQDENGY